MLAKERQATVTSEQALPLAQLLGPLEESQVKRAEGMGRHLS